MRRAAHSSPPRATAGISFVEVVVAAAIVGMVVVTATWAMTEVGITRHVKASDPPIAAQLAREIHQLARSLPTELSGDPVATEGDEVGHLDTLDGAFFEPPIDALLEELTDYAGWSQDIDLEVYDIDDLATPVSGALYDAPPYDETLVKLTVNVRQRGSLMGTYVWWLSP